jgi:tetratricopeptide (TPR) repeat protein
MPPGGSMAYIEMNPKMTILLVDHNDAHAAAMRTHLKRLGYSSFLEKPNGYEALKMIKEGTKVDFILARYNIPVMSGFDLFSEMKADMSINRVPFTIFSEKLDEGDIALLNEAGVDAYLTIPYVSKDLAGNVNSTWSRYIDPTNVEFHFEMARKAFLARKFDDAASKFEDIERTGKLLHRAKISRARVYLKQQKLDEALTLAKEVATKFPSFVHGHQTLGEILMARGDLVGAVGSFKKALDLSPKNPWRYGVIGELLTKLQMWPQAEEIYRMAEKMQVTLPELEKGLAQALIQQGKKTDALEYYLRLVEKSPKDTALLNNVAVCYRSIGEPNKALQYYNKALETEPENIRIMYNMALVQLDKANSTGAIEMLDKILVINPAYEKARLKKMQLKTPAQFKEFMALKKSLGGGDELADEVSGTQAATTVSDDSRSAIAGILGAATPAAPAASAVDLSKISEENLVLIYLQSLQRVRLQTGKLIEFWFARGREFSEELTSDMLTAIQAVSSKPKMDPVKAASLFPPESPTHKKLVDMFQKMGSAMTTVQDEVFQLIEALQFQDYVSQTMMVVEKGYTRFIDSSHTAWKDIAGFLNNDSQRALYKKIDDTQKTASEWTRFNMLTVGLLKLMVQRVEETNVLLKSKLATTEAPAKTLQSGHKALSPLWTSPPPSIPKPTVDATHKLVHDALNCDEPLASLRGLADFNASFNKDVATLASILNLIFSLNQAETAPDQARTQLTKHGADLQQLWATVKGMCATPPQQQCVVNALKVRQG